jgi:hypothetical protein
MTTYKSVSAILVLPTDSKVVTFKVITILTISGTIIAYYPVVLL